MSSNKSIIKELEETFGESIPAVSNTFSPDPLSVKYSGDKVIELKLEGIRIDTLPPIISELDALEKFELDNIELTTINETFGQLNTL